MDLEASLFHLYNSDNIQDNVQYFPLNTVTEWGVTKVSAEHTKVVGTEL